MSDIWPHVSRKNPCPICKKPDWCQIGDRSVKCMRVESPHACPSGGWYHFPGTQALRKAPPRPERVEAPVVDFSSMLGAWQASTADSQIGQLAESLGVEPSALRSIGACWSASNRAWAFPMKSASGNVVGVRLRNNQGAKWAVKGSRQGLFIPSGVPSGQFIAYLPEGPTSLSAVLSMGLYGIGRPNCLTGGEQAGIYLRSIGIFKAVIISDNDNLKQLGNAQARPGIEGAIRTKKDTGLISTIWIPPSPFKDVRDFYKAGGTGSMLASSVAGKVWTKG